MPRGWVRRVAPAVVASAVLAAFAVVALGQAPPLTPVEVLRRATAQAAADSAAVEQYAWRERDILTTLHRDGKPPSVRSDETDAVSEVDGIQYSRMIARDGEPLSPEESAKQARKAADFIRKNNDPKTRARQQRAQAKQQLQRQQLIAALPQAFQVAFAPPGAGFVCACYVVTLTPRPGYHAPGKNLKLLRHVSATLWINRQDFGLVRARFQFLKTVSMGWVVARLEPGSRFELDNERVDGHWFEKSVTGIILARVFLLKHYRLRLSDVCGDYRKFGVSTKVVVR